MPKINQVSPIAVPTKLELKPEVNKLEFNNKIEKLAEKKEMSRADFQSLAKNVVGGEKSLATFLKTNNIVPSADVNQLNKLFHWGKNADLIATITDSSAIKKMVNDKVAVITDPESGITEKSQLPANKLKQDGPGIVKPTSSKNDAYVSESKSLVVGLDKHVTNIKKEISDNRAKLLTLDAESPEAKKLTKDISHATGLLEKFEPKLIKAKKEIEVSKAQLEIEGLSVQDRILVKSNILKNELLVTGLETSVSALKDKIESGKKEFAKPTTTPARKAELSKELAEQKFSLVSLEGKLTSAKTGVKAGITKEGIEGNQASKAGDNLYQKVLATKEHSGGVTTTLLNNDDLGILPSFKPKIKAEGADWAKVKSGFMDGKEGVGMREMTLYRKAYVDQLAQEVADKHGVKIDLNSFGSANLTSDYDATISVKSNKDGSAVDPKTEAKVLQEFNSKFRAEWKVEAGTAFDTNVYLKDFDMVNQESPTYTGDLQKKYESGQNTLALVKQRIHMDQGSWDTYKDKMISSLPESSKSEAIKQYADANKYALSREKELNTEIIKINNPGFVVAGASDGALKSEVSRIKSQPGVHGGDVEAQASNRLYERKLDIVQTKIEAGNAIKTEISNLESKVKSNTATPEDKTKLASLKLSSQENEIDTKMLKGEALFFANEPYFSEGTVRHVVGNLQRFKSEPEKQYEIPKLAALQSLNENTGDTMKDFNHYMDANKPDGNLGKVMFKTSKYVERLCDSLEVTLGGKDKNIPANADHKITLKGKEYDLKAVVADLKSSLKEPLAIRGETREKGSTDEKKSSEAISLFKGSAQLDVFKNVANAGQYKQLLLDITSRANVLARQ